jgi:hypothetical protein
MTLQERRTLVMLMTSIITTTIYGIIMYNRYNTGALNDDNIMRFWAIILLILIPVIVVSQIVTQIIYHIIEAIGIEIRGGDHDELGIEDERDKLIEMKAARTAQYVFVFGFFIALATQLFDYSAHAFFIVIVGFGVITQLLEETLKIIFYRKGV